MTPEKKAEPLSETEREELIRLRMKHIETIDSDIKALKKCINVVADGIMKNKERIEALQKKLGISEEKDKKKEEEDEKVLNYVG